MLSALSTCSLSFLPPTSSLRGAQSPYKMALPVVKTLQDCADFSRTVAPFLPQLYDLPNQILAHYNDFEALKSVYLSTNPLITAFAFALFITPIFLIVSEVNKNYSQVDRCWSILPTVYNVHYCVWAHKNGLNATKLDHLIAFSVIWSVCKNVVETRASD